jgi:hypothetical protein
LKPLDRAVREQPADGAGNDDLKASIASHF